MKIFQFALLMFFLLLNQHHLRSQDTIVSDRHAWWDNHIEYHIVGELKLKRVGNSFYKTDYNADKRWREHFPGIVRAENISVPHNTKLQFYNKEGDLQKVLVLDELNPFWNRFEKPVSRGAYNFEVHKPAPSSMLANLPEPDSFLTILYDVRTDPNNGMTIVNYGLTALYKHFVIYVNSASVVVSPDGEVLNTLILEDASSARLVSNDGELIIYKYGGYLNNPVTPFKKQECRVYDFNQEKDVLRIQAGEHERILGVTVVGDHKEMVHVAYKHIDKDEKYYRLELLNLNKREQYIRDFPRNSFIKTWNRHNSYTQIVQREIDSFDINHF